jgi:hypothetical protein
MSNEASRMSLARAAREQLEQQFARDRASRHRRSARWQNEPEDRAPAPEPDEPGAGVSP